MKRNEPTGGDAYGTPRNTSTPSRCRSRVTITPDSSPYFVLTILELSSALAVARIRPSSARIDDVIFVRALETPSPRLLPFAITRAPPTISFPLRISTRLRRPERARSCPSRRHEDPARVQDTSVGDPCRDVQPQMVCLNFTAVKCSHLSISSTFISSLGFSERQRGRERKRERKSELARYYERELRASEFIIKTESLFAFNVVCPSFLENLLRRIFREQSTRDPNRHLRVGVMKDKHGEHAVLLSVTPDTVSLDDTYLERMVSC